MEIGDKKNHLESSTIISNQRFRKQTPQKNAIDNEDDEDEKRNQWQMSSAIEINHDNG